MTRRAWTTDEMEKLRALYAATENTDLGAMFGRSPMAVKRMAEVSGLRKADDFAGRWTAEDLQTLTRLYPTTSLRELMRVLGRTKNGVFQKARVLGLTKAEGFRDTGRTGAPSTKRLAFLASCKPLLSRPNGASPAELFVACGLLRKAAKSYLFKASRDGQVHTAGKFKLTRYFLTAELAQAGERLIAEEAEQRRAEMLKIKRGRERERAMNARAGRAPKVKAEKPPKPQKQAKPPKPQKVQLVLAKSAPVVKQKPRGPAYLPGDEYQKAPGFKYTVCPTPPREFRTNTFDRY